MICIKQKKKGMKSTVLPLVLSMVLTACGGAASPENAVPSDTESSSGPFTKDTPIDDVIWEAGF